ncbi:hypothetical protein AAMO2058_001399000 [Amorphochlora amoebiformis]
MLGREFEQKLANSKKAVIVGVDEAGRGPLAGPVYAAACYIPYNVSIEGINDSKKLSETERDQLFEKLTHHPGVKYAICDVGVRKIEEINILQAAMLAMDQAVESLGNSGVRPAIVLVDGPRLPVNVAKNYNATAVVKGDSKSFSIAAASILAKVARDRHMLKMDQKWPQYSFAQHKGYPTVSHQTAIRKHGPWVSDCLSPNSYSQAWTLSNPSHDFQPSQNMVRSE